MKIRYSYVDMLMRFEAGTAKEPGGMHVAELMGDQQAILDAALDAAGFAAFTLSDKDWDHLTDYIDTPPPASEEFKKLMRDYSKYREESQCQGQDEKKYRRK